MNVFILVYLQQKFVQRYGTMPRWKSGSRGVISAGASSVELYRSLPRSHSPTSSGGGGTMMRRTIEPSVSIQHFHVPSSGHTQRRRLVYGRPGQKTAMSVLVEEMKARSRTIKERSPSMNNEEPIQVIFMIITSYGKRYYNYIPMGLLAYKDKFSCCFHSNIFLIP